MAGLDLSIHRANRTWCFNKKFKKPFLAEPGDDPSAFSRTCTNHILHLSVGNTLGDFLSLEDRRMEKDLKGIYPV